MKKTEVIQFRITPELKEEILRLAELSGLSLSGWITLILTLKVRENEESAKGIQQPR